MFNRDDRAIEGFQKADADNDVRWAHWLIDLSLLATYFAAPLVLGGRHPLGKLVLAAAILPGSIGVLVKILQGRTLPLSYWKLFLLAACLLIPAVQASPRSGEVLRPLASVIPAGTDMPGVTKQVVRDHATLSVSAVTTKKALPLAVIYACLFVMILCRLESAEDIEHLLILLIGAALLLTALALIQANFGNGRFLWWYDHPSRQPLQIPRGPFQNENHLASLLATVFPCMLYFLFRKHRVQNKEDRCSRPTRKDRLWTSRGKRAGGDGLITQWRRWASAVGCAVLVVTVYATPSRGGAAVIALAGTIWLGILLWNCLGTYVTHRIDRQTWIAVGAATAVVLFALGLAGLYLTVEQFSHARAQLWAADFALWRDFPLWGIGVGNHRFAYRAYLPEYYPVTFSTAESSVLQILVETGVVGMAVMTAVIGSVLAACLRTLMAVSSMRQVLLVGALSAGLSASCIHAVGDFPWHIPSCLAVVLALAACISRLANLTITSQHAGQQPTARLSVNLSLVLAVGIVGGNAWALMRMVPVANASLCWDEYRRVARSDGSDDPSDDPSKDPKHVIELLEQTLDHDPTHIQARAKLTYHLTSQFERTRFQLDAPELAAAEILRQAALVAKLCPLESRTYMCAAIAAGALGASTKQQQHLLEKSNGLRLVDGQVSLRRGLLALTMQDEQLAYEQFACAVNQDPAFRAHGLRTLNLLFSPEQLIERINLSTDSLAALYTVTMQSGTVEHKQVVSQAYCQRLWEQAGLSRSIDETQVLLSTAYQVASHLKDKVWMRRIVSKQLETHPRNVDWLLTRAELSHTLEMDEQAAEDIKQCLQIAPHDSRVRRLALELDRAAFRR